LLGRALNIAASLAHRLRVLAGPGTGKSFALKRRVARWLEEGVAPDRILAVTFTRNAARALVDDLRSIGVDGADDIRASTLHSFCFRLLRDEDALTYLGRVARPLVIVRQSGIYKFEAAPLLADVEPRGDFGSRRDMTARLIAFEAAWARLQNETPGWPIDAVDAAFQEAVVDWLTFHEAMLIGEVVPEALRYLRNNPASHWLTAFDHIVVDEYQDLNKAEQTLIDVLASSASLSIVGDEDQSIYSFRYAHPEGVTSFPARHPETADEPLEECRRCPRAVVEIADALIRHNHPPPSSVRLCPSPSAADGIVHLVQWTTMADEIDGLADYIEHLVRGEGYAPGDILLLSQRRHIAYAIRDRLVGKNVPVHSFYYEESLEDERAQERFALLTLATYPEDRVALRYWLGVGSPTWNRQQYAKLRRMCDQTGRTPRDVLHAVRVGELNVNGIQALVTRFGALEDEIARVSSLSLPDAVDSLFPAGEEWTSAIRDIANRLTATAETLHALIDGIKAGITQPEMPE